ncbi:hypothetical protein BU25DRAFT_21779 [Macroventuria anomochaeta]|uniref:Uncharacterized protein n=1 Tax=Macroventuria anomochaeta TaxID=301207 RepID=A0ACB6S880_9PLEO|nr:uncharacterized protein BU25DRAFT_21779 [Macroventuria anomochaeta]KAF2629424.1 hypothetical protein BU25DRAFT_21779 [Macroventuria anomochaeta]
MTVTVIHHQLPNHRFLLLGAHIEVLATNVEVPLQVVAFLAPEYGTPYVAPLALVTYNEAQKSCLRLATTEAVEVFMPDIMWVPAFQVIGTVEDRLALVSLAILYAADKEFEFVEHRVPVIVWCRVHLAKMVKRDGTKKREAEHVLQLKRAQAQMVNQAVSVDQAEQTSQPAAKRARLDNVSSNDAALIPAPFCASSCTCQPTTEPQWPAHKRTGAPARAAVCMVEPEHRSLEDDG